MSVGTGVSALSHDEATTIVERIRAFDEDLDELVERFVAAVPRPDARELLMDERLSAAHVAAIAIDYETIEIEGMTIPLWRYMPGRRMIRFTDPRRTALHWIGSFAAVIRSGEEYSDQGFGVHRGLRAHRAADAITRWREWTGRELGDDVYELYPLWGREESIFGPARDLPIVAPRTFLLALLDAMEREAIDTSGGAFGRGG